MTGVTAAELEGIRREIRRELRKDRGREFPSSDFQDGLWFALGIIRETKAKKRAKKRPKREEVDR